MAARAMSNNQNQTPRQARHGTPEPLRASSRAAAAATGQQFPVEEASRAVQRLQVRPGPGAKTEDQVENADAVLERLHALLVYGVSSIVGVGERHADIAELSVV